MLPKKQWVQPIKLLMLPVNGSYGFYPSDWNVLNPCPEPYFRRKSLKHFNFCYKSL